MIALTKPEKKILFAVLSILTALCTMAYIAHLKSQRLIRSSEAIEQSEEIKYHIKEVLGGSVDMEFGVKGYVMTGDESYMEPANQSIASLFLHLHELSAAPGMTEEQRNHIDELSKLVDEKSTIDTRTIELRRQRGMKDAIDFITQGKEKDLMTQIRGITGTMLQDEDFRLAKLKVENRKAILHFAVTFYFLLIKIGITVGTVVFLLILYFRNRRRSEKVLKENQELFHDILDHSDSIISIKDLTGRYVLINQAFENQFKIQKEDAVGKTAFDLFDRDAAEHIRNTDLEIIRILRQKKFEEIIPRDTDVIHYSSLKFPLFDTNLIPYAICSISTDETEKTQNENLHRDQMNRILDLFNNAPCGYQATDDNGIIIEINDTLLRWLGYTREEVIGKLPVKEIISPENQHQFIYYFPRIRSGEIKSIFDLEIIYIRKDRTKLSVIANTMAQYDEHGNFLYTRTSVFDISYRKRVEEVATKN